MNKFFKKLKNSFRKRIATLRTSLVQIIAIDLNLILGRNVVLDGFKLPYKKIPKASVVELKRGTYEDVERDFIRKYLPPGVFVIEIGASIGIISCHILKKNPVRLISFEAVERWSNVARETVYLNYPKDIPFELIHSAVGAVGQSEVTFSFSDDSNLGGYISSLSTDLSITVPALSLFDLNRVYGVPVGAWLIMDIEGTEWKIIKNQGASLGPYKGIIVECHNVMDGKTLITPQQIVAEFIKNGFSLMQQVDHGTHIVAAFERPLN